MNIDQQTWTSVQKGDLSAFELLYRDTVMPLTNQAYRIVKDEELVKDIVQDVFVSLYTKKNKLPAGLNVAGYLSNAVKYKVSTFLRDKLNKETHHLRLLKESSESEPAQYEKNEISHQIKAGINILPEKCREAFILNYFENLTYKAIAQRMGISVKTVEKHISKALAMLRKELKQEQVILLVITLAAFNHGSM